MSDSDPDNHVEMSADLKKRLDRHNRTVDRLYTSINILWSIALLLAIIATFAQGLRLIGFMIVCTSVLLVVCATAIVMTVLYRRFRASSFNRLKRLGRAEGLLNALRLEYPELAALQEAMELVNQEKAEASDRRGFWISTWQSLFFLLLGILISYALTRLGWLR